jgi:hypothetical protein
VSACSLVTIFTSDNPNRHAVFLSSVASNMKIVQYGNESEVQIHILSMTFTAMNYFLASLYFRAVHLVMLMFLPKDLYANHAAVTDGIKLKTMKMGLGKPPMT